MAQSKTRLCARFSLPIAQWNPGKKRGELQGPDTTKKPVGRQFPQLRSTWHELGTRELHEPPSVIFGITASQPHTSRLRPSRSNTIQSRLRRRASNSFQPCAHTVWSDGLDGWMVLVAVVNNGQVFLHSSDERSSSPV